MTSTQAIFDRLLKEALVREAKDIIIIVHVAGHEREDVIEAYFDCLTTQQIIAIRDCDDELENNNSNSLELQIDFATKTTKILLNGKDLSDHLYR